MDLLAPASEGRSWSGSSGKHLKSIGECRHKMKTYDKRRQLGASCCVGARAPASMYLPVLEGELSCTALIDKSMSADAEL